jgi:hypothetical protein
MKKLKLDLNTVKVESFETTAGNEGIATVHGHQDLNPFGMAGEPYEQGVNATDLNSCPTNWCGTCALSCWNTCAASCPGTSGQTEP